MKLRISLVILLFIALSVLTRLPLLKSEHMILDLDECTIGMMAAHQYEGKEISPYFWGQAYGFSFVETTVICISYAVGGISDEAVKIPMLALWIIGMIFFFLTLLQVNEKSRLTPIIITLLFILSPAWAIWSMKARGGYLTAFTLGSILMYLLFHRKYGHKNSSYIVAGILLSIIFEAQALWIPGLAPIILYRLLQEKSRKKWLYIFITSLGCFIGFTLYRLHLSHHHDPKVFAMQNIWWNFQRIPDYLYNNQHGMYFFDYLKNPNNYTSAFAIVFSALAYFLLISGIYGIARGRRNQLFGYTLLSVIITLFYTIFMLKEEPRYLLPITGFILFALQAYLNTVSTTKYMHAFLIALSLWGAVATYSLRDFSFCNTKKKELNIAIEYLLDKGVHHVYCTDWILQWQIMFYSHEKILARQQEIPDRCPAYNLSVDKALYLHKPVAVITSFDNGIDLHIPCQKVPGFNIYLNPVPEQLLNAHFPLWPKRTFFSESF